MLYAVETEDGVRVMGVEPYANETDEVHFDSFGEALEYADNLNQDGTPGGTFKPVKISTDIP